MAVEKRAGRLLEAVLENAPVGLAFFDRQLELARSNAAFAGVAELPAASMADVEQVFHTRTPILNREVVLPDGRQWLFSHFPVIVDGDVMWVGTIATDITALRRAERERLDLLDAERRARGAAERLAERLARLHVVTARLSGATDPDEVAAVVCDHGAAGLGAGSGALMVLVDDGRSFRMLRQTGYGRDVEDTYRTFPADAPLPACDAVRTRSMVLLTDLADRDRRYPSLAGVAADHEAHAVIPLVYGERALGAVSFAFREPRTFDDDDRRFLLAIASQASQALERARLHAAERDATRRQTLLAETSGLLATSLDPVDALGSVARLLIDGFVSSCAVEVADGSAVSVGSVRGEQSSTITIPLRARGNELGVMVLSRDEGDFAADDLAIAAELADRLAMALDNARAHRARAEQAQTLQASLLPPRLPDIPGLTIDSRYQPIGDGSLVGGDFYDVFPLDDDRWAFMIGDVCGQGVTAASLTSLVRYTARAAARQWSSPAEVLRFTNAVLGEHDLGERFCTLLLVTIERGGDGDGARAVIASGGHHLPLLHRPSVGVTRVGVAGSALGLFDDAHIRDEVVLLESGDTLVLFTDGVVEARHPDGEQVGDDLLERLIDEHAPAGPAAVGAAVEKAVLDLGGGRSRDDMALLAVRVDPVEVPRRLGRTLERRYRAEASSVPDARVSVREWLDANHLVPARADDILVAITELVTNAVRSARTAVEVRAWATPEVVNIEVIDDGPGFDPSIPHDARELDPLAERGRGLFLVASLADECTIESGPKGTIVRCAVSR